MDTTVDKKLAAQFDVHSYPTLKFRVAAADGWKDYDGGRKGPDLLAFAERMAGPPLPRLQAEADLAALVNRSSVAGSGVAFVFGGGGAAFTGAGGGAEAAAKAVQHKAYCGAVGATLAWHGVALPGSEGPAYVAAVEAGEAPRLCPAAVAAGSAGAETMEKWMAANDAPLLTELGALNFRKLGKMGKVNPALFCLFSVRARVRGVLTCTLESQLLVIAVADPLNASTPAYLDSVRAVARSLLAETAAVGVRERFVFGHLDGAKWAEFVEQYNIFKGELPRLVVVDAPKELFYEDQEVDELDEMATFLRQVAAGQVPAQKENTGGWQGAAWRFYYKVRALGWRAGLVAVPLVALVVAACVAKPEDEDPYNAKYRPSQAQVDRLRPKED